MGHKDDNNTAILEAIERRKSGIKFLTAYIPINPLTSNTKSNTFY